MERQPELEEALVDIAARLDCPANLRQIIRVGLHLGASVDDMAEDIQKAIHSLRQTAVTAREVGRRTMTRARVRLALCEIAEALGCPRRVQPGSMMTLPAGQDIPAGALVEMGDDGRVYRNLTPDHVGLDPDSGEAGLGFTADLD